MKKIVCAFGLIFCFAGVSVAQFDESMTGTFDVSFEIMTKSSGQTTVKIDGKGYFKGNKVVVAFSGTYGGVQVEGKLLGQGQKLIIAFPNPMTGEKTFQFNKRWMLDFVNPDYKQFGGKKTKDVEVGGKKCELYEYEVLDQMQKKATREDTICEGWFPAKMVIDSWIMPGQQTTIMASNLKTGESFPDTVFDPPAGYKTGGHSQAWEPLIIQRFLSILWGRKAPHPFQSFPLG